MVQLDSKNLPAQAGDKRYMGLIPGLGRSPGGGHGNPLQHSCLENLMDRGSWRATVHRVTKSQTQGNLAQHTHQKSQAAAIGESSVELFKHSLENDWFGARTTNHAKYRVSETRNKTSCGKSRGMVLSGTASALHLVFFLFRDKA